MTKLFENKVAIITGGGRGLGKAIAIGLAKEGLSGICITSAKSREQLDQTASEIEALHSGVKILPFLADVTDPNACRRTVEATSNILGIADILINNAGKGQNYISNNRVPFWEAKINGWREIVDTNINGPFLMAREVVGGMMKKNWGRIINISKSCDSMHRAQNSPYGATKAALEAISLSWAQDLINTGVTVNTLAPGGSVDTDFVLPAVRRQILNKEINKHFYPAEVIVPAAVWLASSASDGITGCRYIGANWDQTLPAKKAAENAREKAIFHPPKRDTSLINTWIDPQNNSN